MAINLTGVKTVATGAALVVLPTLVEYVGHIDWSQILGPKGAFIASGLTMIVLRMFTNTPIFQKSASVDPADPRLGGLQ